MAPGSAGARAAPDRARALQSREIRARRCVVAVELERPLERSERRVLRDPPTSRPGRDDSGSRRRSAATTPPGEAPSRHARRHRGRARGCPRNSDALRGRRPRHRTGIPAGSGSAPAEAPERPLRDARSGRRSIPTVPPSAAISTTCGPLSRRTGAAGCWLLLPCHGTKPGGSRDGGKVRFRGRIRSGDGTDCDPATCAVSEIGQSRQPTRVGRAVQTGPNPSTGAVSSSWPERPMRRPAASRARASCTDGRRREDELR